MIRHHKVVAALPTPLEADSVYYVRVGTGVDIFVTNSTGLVASYKPNFQAANANLDALATLTGAADRLPYFSGVGALSLATLTAFGRSLLALADDPAARTLLKLSNLDQPTFAGVLFNAFTKIYPESNGLTIQLGSTTAATGYITIKSTGEMVLESAGMSVGGSLLPKTTTILLGSPALPWSIAYVKTLAMTGAINNAPPVTLDSAATLAIGTAAASTINVAGAVTITAFDAIAAGVTRTLVFVGALTLTHDATKLILPTGASIVTAAGDVAVMESMAAGNWRCLSYTRRDGKALVATPDASKAASGANADITSIRAIQYVDKVYVNAAASGTVTLDLSLYSSFDLTLVGNTTLAFSNPPALTNEGLAVVVSITCGATGYTTTWMSGVTLWLNTGATIPPGPVANKTGEFVFSTRNGTAWTGRKASSL